MINSGTYFKEAVERQPVANMGERHELLRQVYLEAPAKARIIDGAKTSCANVPASKALYAEVIPNNAKEAYAIGVHTAVGGQSDFPVPGDILCAALASCLDSTIRIIANRLGITLTELEVTVEAEVDVHGTLRFDDKVPVGFQNIRMNVALDTEKPVQEALLDAMLNAAEHSCVIIQTLRNAPEISVTRALQKQADEELKTASVA